MQSISTAVAAAAAGFRRATKLPASSKQPKASRVQLGPVIFRPATLFVPGSARPKFKLDAAFDQGGKQPIACINKVAYETQLIALFRGSSSLA